MTEARALAESPAFSDLDRAELVFRLGACRFKVSSTGTAIALFGEALALAERSELPCDVLRADIFQWRSRCHRRQRDFEAAREDAERALELAQAVGDRSMTANSYFQASLVAERTGHWVLSRSYAEQAKALYQELNDERTVGRVLNNLGGLNLLLGKPQEAIELLKSSFAVAVEVESQGDAAVAMGGLGTVHLQLGDWEEAEKHARHALELLGGSRGLPRRDRRLAARPRPLADGARASRRGGGVLPGRRRRLRTAFLCQPSRGRLGRARRSGCSPR